MMKEDASNYRSYIEVARLYRSGPARRSRQNLGNIIEQMLAGREENDLLELVDELLAGNPEHVPGLRCSPEFTWWQRDMEKLRGHWNASLKPRKLPAFPTRNATP